MINISQPNLGAEELEAVREVFAGNWLGYGPRTKRFEAEFAEYLDVEPERLIFINSATSGLFLAMELLDLGPGDDVLLPSVSFIAAPTPSRPPAPVRSSATWTRTRSTPRSPTSSGR